MKNIKLLIFDQDNTLINYGGVTEKAWQLASKKCTNTFDLSIDVKNLTNQIMKVNDAIWNDETKRPKGNFSFQELRTDIVTTALKNFNIKDEMITDFLVQQYAVCKYDAIYVFEDVFDTLKQLKARGYQLALLTNGNAMVQREKLRRFHLESLFDGIFIDGEQGIGKPERKAYENVLNFFHLIGDEACMIGDHYLWEVVAPKKYGLHAIWVNRGNLGVKGNERIKADAMIYNIGELLNILE